MDADLSREERIERAAFQRAKGQPMLAEDAELLDAVEMEMALIAAFNGFQELRGAMSYEPQLVAAVRAKLLGERRAQREA